MVEDTDQGQQSGAQVLTLVFSIISRNRPAKTALKNPISRGTLGDAKPHASQSDERAPSVKKAQFENSQKSFYRILHFGPLKNPIYRGTYIRGGVRGMMW